MHRGRKKFYTLSGIIPANTTAELLAKDIDGSVVFHSEYIRGEFETLLDDGGNTVDYGVCPFSFKIEEGGTNYQFMDNFVFADMLLAPGRRKSANATNNATAPATNPIYEPTEFVHSFQKRINVFVSNNSDVDQFFSITFEGSETKAVA